MESWLQCPQCGTAFQRGSQRGRAPTYCTNFCRHKAYSERRRLSTPVMEDRWTTDGMRLYREGVEIGDNPVVWRYICQLLNARD